jgi:hypothetical protein
MLSQPDNTSCGPTCLHAVYHYFDYKIRLETLLKEIKQFDDGGGTLAVILANHALSKGFDAILYSYNLNVFDPTWSSLGPDELINKLKTQMEIKKKDKKFQIASKSYIHFIENGGQLQFDDLTPNLIAKFLDQKLPILTGLSSTYLYKTMREDPILNEEDDIGGLPSGHFVVLHGINRITNKVQVADPYQKNPMSQNNYYSVNMNRLIGAIFLGIVTYDGNLLMIYPKKGHK